MARKGKIDRVKMVKAMEFIARQINNEETLMSWLWSGVADGDIEYGNFDVDDGSADCYVEYDEDFADLMHTFLRCMVGAYNDGGLYCDNVVSKES